MAPRCDEARIPHDVRESAGGRCLGKLGGGAAKQVLCRAILGGEVTCASVARETRSDWDLASTRRYGSLTRTASIVVATATPTRLASKGAWKPKAS